jgi:cytochrome c oxidase assembly protein subunit 15
MTVGGPNFPGVAERTMAIWLLLCCALIFAMVVLGGVTRLTGSGLSMVEWDPIFGIVPPLSEADWEDVFQKYRRSPEYREVNLGMDLGDFKTIYYFEYAHRVLGRVIGMAFVLPFLYFWARGWIGRGMAAKLMLVLLLGGLQGLLGWYMVMSGLVEDPRVSHYRLTTHLLLAFLICGYMFWVALDLLYPRALAGPNLRGLRRLALAVSGLIAITVASGGLVAGLDAGLRYNTFPLMGGQVLPPDLLVREPTYRNFLDNETTVQFDHRILATFALIAIVTLWLHARRQNLWPRARLAFHCLLAAIVVQVTLGISTLLLVVPVALASAHQAGALALFTLALFVNHELRSDGVATSPVSPDSASGAADATGPVGTH